MDSAAKSTAEPATLQPLRLGGRTSTRRDNIGRAFSKLVQPRGHPLRMQDASWLPPAVRATVAEPGPHVLPPVRRPAAAPECSPIASWACRLPTPSASPPFAPLNAPSPVPPAPAALSLPPPPRRPRLRPLGRPGRSRWVHLSPADRRSRRATLRLSPDDLRWRATTSMWGGHLPRWRNWQTHYLEVVAPARAWRFKSSPRHFLDPHRCRACGPPRRAGRS